MNTVSKILFVLPLLSAFAVSQAGAKPPAALNLIAATGDSISGATLHAAGPPAIDSAGDVAFLATLSGPGLKSADDTAILLYTGTDVPPTVIARAGDADPVTGGTFTKFSDPVLSGSGCLGFLGSLKVNGAAITAGDDQALYLYSSGALAIAIQKGGVVEPGQGPGFPSFTLSSITQFAVEQSGTVAFSCIVSAGAGAKATRQGLFFGGAGGPFTEEEIDVTHNTFVAFQPLPYASGQTRSIDAVNGNTCDFNIVTDAPALPHGATTQITAGVNNEELFFTGPAPSPGVIQDPVPLQSIDEPAVNANGSLACRVRLYDGAKLGAEAIYLVTSGTGGYFNNTIEAQTGAAAPGTSGAASPCLFSKVSDPVLNNNDAIAFVGFLKTGGATGATAATSSGIWSDYGGVLSLAVRAGDPAPGTSGTFAAFRQVVLPDTGGPVFEATFTARAGARGTGVWAVAADGSITPVIVTGSLESVHGAAKTVKSISIFTVPKYCGCQSRSFDAATAQLVFEVTFTDKTWAVYSVPDSIQTPPPT